MDLRDDDTGPQRPNPARHDPAAPHTAPLPSHIPRWLAWIVLVALSVSAVLCVRIAVR